MSNQLCVVGFDPSLTHWGMASAMLDLDTGVLADIAYDICVPDVVSGKQVRKNSSDLDRAKQLAEFAFFYAEQAHTIFVEVPVGSQSARSMASYGVCVGVLAALESRSFSIIQVTPMEVKKTFTGDKAATKKMMMARAIELHPDAPYPQHKNGSPITTTFEHQADALAAIYAGIATPQFRQLLQMQRKIPCKSASL